MNNKTPREKLNALKRNMRDMEPEALMRMLFEVAEEAVKETEDLKRVSV